MLVGPRVKKFACHELFDHTTLINTILTRFADNPQQAIETMGPRVAGAQSLGVALEQDACTAVPEPTEARAAIAAWRNKAHDMRLPDGGKSKAADGAGQPLVLHDFQQDFVGFVRGSRGRWAPARPALGKVWLSCRYSREMLRRNSPNWTIAAGAAGAYAGHIPA